MVIAAALLGRSVSYANMARCILIVHAIYTKNILQAQSKNIVRRLYRGTMRAVKVPVRKDQAVDPRLIMVLVLVSV